MPACPANSSLRTSNGLNLGQHSDVTPTFIIANLKCQTAVSGRITASSPPPSVHSTQHATPPLTCRDKGPVAPSPSNISTRRYRSEQVAYRSWANSSRTTYTLIARPPAHATLLGINTFTAVPMVAVQGLLGLVKVGQTNRLGPGRFGDQSSTPTAATTSSHVVLPTANLCVWCVPPLAPANVGTQHYFHLLPYGTCDVWVSMPTGRKGELCRPER